MKESRQRKIKKIGERASIMARDIASLIEDEERDIAEKRTRRDEKSVAGIKEREMIKEMKDLQFRMLTIEEEILDILGGD